MANPPSESKVWPGAFVLSTDGKIGRVYQDVVGDRFPAALSFAQCAAIVGQYISAKDAKDFAGELAAGVTEDILLARASALDAKTAHMLADAVKNEAFDIGDAYQLRFDYETSLAQKLKEGSSIAEDETAETRAAVAAHAITRVRDRKHLINQQIEKRALDARRNQEIARAAAIALADMESARADDLERQRDAAIAAASDRNGRSASHDARNLRWLLAGVLLGMAAIAALFSAVLTEWITFVLCCFVALGVWFTHRDWVDGKTRLMPWLWSLALAVIGLIGLLR